MFGGFLFFAVTISPVQKVEMCVVFVSICYDELQLVQDVLYVAMEHSYNKGIIYQTQISLILVLNLFDKPGKTLQTFPRKVPQSLLHRQIFLQGQESLAFGRHF